MIARPGAPLFLVWQVWQFVSAHIENQVWQPKLAGCGRGVAGCGRHNLSSVASVAEVWQRCLYLMKIFFISTYTLATLATLKTRGPPCKNRYAHAGTRARGRAREEFTVKQPSSIAEAGQQLSLHDRSARRPKQAPEACVEILRRLREGQEWLTAKFKDVDGGGAQENRQEWLMVGMDRWMELEATVRFVYDYEGCVMAPERCDPEAPLCCEACSDTWAYRN